MLVKCITNDVDQLSAAMIKSRLKESIHRDGADNDLIVGNTYIVSAMDSWGDGGIRVYLHTVPESDHPYPYPIEMFEVIDSAVGSNWCVAFEQQSLGTCIKRISFPEWANDDSFYERLVEGDESAIAIYKYRKKE